MSTYSYNASIPQATDNPSVSQGQILTNMSSISGLISEDHIGFNTANGGLHEQVTLPANNVPGAQSGLASTIYSNPGVANTNASMLFFKNSQATVGAPALLLSCIRAYASFNGQGGNPITTTQKWNVTSIGHSGTGHYEITIDSGALTGSSFGVLSNAGTASNGAILNSNYAITGANTFTISTYQYESFALRDSNVVTFVVFQI